ADLGHQEHAIPAVRERFAHDVFRRAVVVLPRVVHERDAGVDRRVRDADAFALGACHRQVIAAETEGRHAYAGRTKGTLWNLHRSTMIRQSCSCLAIRTTKARRTRM